MYLARCTGGHHAVPAPAIVLSLQLEGRSNTAVCIMRVYRSIMFFFIDLQLFLGIPLRSWQKRFVLADWELHKKAEMEAVQPK